MQTQNIIKAKDYLIEENSKNENECAVEMDDDDVILHIFGDQPDYNNPDFEKLWSEFSNKSVSEISEYCLSQGVDIMNGDNPVVKFRDIAVMLKAIEIGLLELKQ